MLHLANVYLENASRENDPNITLVLCHDTEVSLSQARKAVRLTEDRTIREEIASIHIELGRLLENRGHMNEAQDFYKKAEKLGVRVQDQQHRQPQRENATIPRNIFPDNLSPPAIVFNPPEPDARLMDTRQLACCLGLLQASIEPDDILDTAARNWVQFIKDDPEEEERLMILALDVIRAFKRDELKDAKSVAEVLLLAPILENDVFRDLLREFYSGIDQSSLLNIHQLEGLAHLIQSAYPGNFDADDLVKVLTLLSTRLRDTHQQSTYHIYQLTMAVSHVLDAMADVRIRGLDRDMIDDPLSSYLDGLKSSSDPYLVYQAAYAYQALQCIPDSESVWQSTSRYTRNIQGVSGLLKVEKGIDLAKFMEGLEDIQRAPEGMVEVHGVKTAYENTTSLEKSGQELLGYLKEGSSFSHKCGWYPALRGADILIRDGQLADFRKLVIEAPCRHDAPFQWGVCQRLGQVATDSMWDAETRRSAIAFLGEIYRNDDQWGQNATIKQMILNILLQLASGSDEKQCM
ncbi:hypothetical protein BGX34_007376 [Mortierella sp. NVP85]|nr:hypothetical protein BGX34_007376 [Mortierella sp. NVP85]